MYGPSRCTPSTRAAPGARSAHAGRRPANAASRSAAGAVIVVASKAVVPWAAWHCATRTAASPPSMMSRPPPPCTCRSMKPGSTTGRSESRTALCVDRRAGNGADAATRIEADRPVDEALGAQDVSAQCPAHAPSIPLCARNQNAYSPQFLRRIGVLIHRMRGRHMPACGHGLGSGWPFSGHARGRLPGHAGITASTPWWDAASGQPRMDLRPATPTPGLQVTLSRAKKNSRNAGSKIAERPPFC